MHEGGYRAPFLVRHPRLVEPGVTEQQFRFFDMLETVADIAGVPSARRPSSDGQSVLPTLLGRAQPQPATGYWEYCKPNELKDGWGQALRRGDWKLLRLVNHSQDRLLLFDLGADPSEAHDVSSQHPDLVRSMHAEMQAQHAPDPYCHPFSG